MLERIKKIIFLSKELIFISFFILQINVINAQIKPNFSSEMDKDTIIDKSYFKFSNSFLTNDVFNGRQDSIAKPHLKPSIGYVSKYGFTTSVTGYYLTLANENKFDYFSFDINYSYDLTDAFTIGTVANRTFYNQSSSSIKSNIKGSLGANLDYDFDFVELFVQGDLMFSEKKDFCLDIELLREFTIEKEDGDFSITPTFDINFNTLNYYEGSLNKKIKKKKVGSITTISTTTSEIIVNNNTFSLLDYEASLPVSYETKHFVFFIIPTLAIPQHTIYTSTVTTTTHPNGSQTITSKDATPASEYNLKNNFFAEIGLYYKL